jgi:hypothetical protein
MTRLWPDGNTVETWGEGETPAGFFLAGTPHRVDRVHDRWRIHTRWWQPIDPPLCREYIKVTTDTGLLCLLCRDDANGAWLLARIYD